MFQEGSGSSALWEKPWLGSFASRNPTDENRGASSLMFSSLHIFLSAYSCLHSQSAGTAVAQSQSLLVLLPKRSCHLSSPQQDQGRPRLCLGEEKVS